MPRWTAKLRTSSTADRRSSTCDVDGFRRVRATIMSSSITGNHIDQQLQRLLRSRSVFPHLHASLAGHRHARTAPFYISHGFNVAFDFGHPLSKDEIKALNDIGHWTNQNFIVRLCAVLEDGGLLGNGVSIRRDCPGNEEVDLLRRLRNVVAHTDGVYDPSNATHKTLYDRLISHFKLAPNEHPETDGKFPIPIDEVLLPLAKRCKAYADAAGSSSPGAT
jgi:hypothetical protein